MNTKIPSFANSNPIQQGMWGLGLGVKSLGINKKPSDVTKDAILQSYLLIYPYVQDDFIHKTDFASFISAYTSGVDKTIDNLQTRIDELIDIVNELASNYGTHTHIATSIGAPTTPSVTEALPKVVKLTTDLIKSKVSNKTNTLPMVEVAAKSPSYVTGSKMVTPAGTQYMQSSRLPVPVMPSPSKYLAVTSESMVSKEVPALLKSTSPFDSNFNNDKNIITQDGQFSNITQNAASLI